ncbi:MAG TPA: efflux RND transporter periplasmic adaptor subunit [Polyangiaceae bacterium]|nr:efflux RND transporter periplasmic adaptor subunit [Polyangiaceae bacterium]
MVVDARRRPGGGRGVAAWAGAPLALAALAALSAGCGGRGGGAEASKDTAGGVASAAPAAVRVRFARAEHRSLPPVLEFNGTLDAEQSSEVATQVAGVVSKIPVDVGTRVKRGETLAVLDTRDAGLRVTQAQANAEQARARLGLDPGEKFDPNLVPDVRAAREAMDLANTEAARAKSLVESGAASQAAYDNARSAAERAKAQYDAALSSARQSWASYGAAQAQLSQAQKAAADSVIRAPFDGAVAERKINVGEYANTGRALVTLVQDHPLRLRLDVPENDLPRLGVGSRVVVTVAAYPGRTFEGVVRRIGASVRAQSRTLPVEAEVPNDKGELRPGFFARASVVLQGQNESAIVVPQAALGTTGSSTRVFVRAGGRVSERLVLVGRQAGDLVAVSGNVAPGDEVAVENVAQLSDGVEVTTP